MFAPGGPSLGELLKQALTSTQRGYDMLAPKFDKTPFRTPEPIVEALHDVLGPPGSIGSALDVCCGTGAALRHLKVLSRDRVVGYDFSEGMLDQARRSVESAPGAAKVELVRGDALALPYENEFDVVTCFGALGHFDSKDEDAFVGGIARSLRPGGRFVFATGQRPGPKNLAFWLSHGFNAVMRVRNALIRPPFIMYYLTFLWPEVRPLLERHGLSPDAIEGLCARPFDSTIFVVAAKR